MRSRRLIVFGRLPEAGVAKTRLVPAVGRQGAANLYQAFLDDVIRTAESIERVDTELWVPPRDGAREVLAERYPHVRIRTQRGPDLGARMTDAFNRTFAEGAHHALLTGSDHPTLPAAVLDRGLSDLVAAPLVLGPSADGGYYAIALRRDAWPKASGLFENIPWSTPHVLPVTRRRAAALGLCHVDLPAWYDVDQPADLERLGRDVRRGSSTHAALRALRSRP